MNEMLDLKLVLLRGESYGPIEMEGLGRSSRLRMKLQKKSELSDRLSINILGLIADGRLAPGGRIPPERHIAEALSISRICVRSAFDRLKENGYIESVQGAGTRVVRSSEKLDQLYAAHLENVNDLGNFCAYLDEFLTECVDLADPSSAVTDIFQLLLGVSGPRRRFDPAIEYQVRLDLARASGSPTLELLLSKMARGYQCYYNSIPRIDRVVDQLADTAGTMITAARAGDKPALVTAVRERNRIMRSAVIAGQGGPARQLASDDLVLRELSAHQPEKLSDIIAQEIAGMLARADGNGEDVLLGERRLADVFGVSRVSIRHALQKLKGDGLVISRERFWTRATRGDEETVVEARESVEENVREFKLLCNLRHFQEVWAARRAARHATKKDKADLKRILSEMRRPIDSLDRSIDLDLNLHLTIARSAGSALHFFVNEVLRGTVTNYFAYTLKNPDLRGPRDVLIAQHEAIVSAIVAGDEDGARDAMERHVRFFQHNYNAYVFGAAAA
ncbi:FCD domain-containing protein [Hoeflea sp.]|uniref:FCD domain-containing protein n=1 Tax=Hoeflea sp. TaxID=1940281 RepID=UPI0019B2FD6E|nr:FCD domain-containing protein [Hoeflea sp.]MBC7285304.1 GntR family transcriptional regulator [Hoeflea sp.]